MLCALLTMLLLYASACEVGGRIAGTIAAIVPLLAIPVSIVGTFAVMEIGRAHV